MKTRNYVIANVCLWLFVAAMSCGAAWRSM